MCSSICPGNSLCGPHWPRTHKHPPASSSQVLPSKVCTRMPSEAGLLNSFNSLVVSNLREPQRLEHMTSGPRCRWPACWYISSRVTMKSFVVSSFVPAVGRPGAVGGAPAAQPCPEQAVQTPGIQRAHHQPCPQSLAGFRGLSPPPLDQYLLGYCQQIFDPRPGHTW